MNSPGGSAVALPGIKEGMRGMRFIATAVASSRAGAVWAMLG